MASDANYFLNKTLGEDFFESLAKFELWKPGTRTTIDHEEIKTALMIVPRTVMALLIRQLTPMNIGETKEFGLQISKYKTAMVRLTKHERDVYSGEVLENNKRVVDFKYRSIPGVGLIIMSAFELYDTSKLMKNDEESEKEASDIAAQDLTLKVQHLIDERLALHDLIGKVVEKKMEQRDAIKQLIMAKISETLPKAEKPKDLDPESFMPEIHKSEPISTKKESPLKGFLDQKKNKIKPSEFDINMSKGEHVHCPDCLKNIFDGEVFSGCVCLGDDREKKVYIKKTEEGVKIRFGRGWDHENIEMLLEVLRSKRG